MQQEDDGRCVVKHAQVCLLLSSGPSQKKYTPNHCEVGNLIVDEVGYPGDESTA